MTWYSKKKFSTARKEVTRNCNICGKEYIKNPRYSICQWSISKFCSYKCASEYKKLKPIKAEIKICNYCGNKYQKNKKFSSIQWNRSKFCSNICFNSFSRKYKSKLDKYKAHKKRHGILDRGSDELSKRISYLTKLAMQRPDVQEKIRQPKGTPTLEQRMLLSEALKGKIPKNLMYGPNIGKFSNIKRGEYDINGTTIFFRSMWEANYALYLDFLIDRGEIEKWEFEPDTFIFEKIKFGTRSYTPDFKIFNKNGSIEYHEIKGYMDSKSKTKLRRMRIYYPKIKIVLIDKSEYNLIKKQIGKLCKFYD